MIKKQNEFKTDKKVKKIKRIRGAKNKEVKIKKFFRKKLYMKRSRKTPSIYSEGKTIFTDISSSETLGCSYEYKNELLKIIKNIISKYKIESDIEEKNINEKINNIILAANMNKINIVLDIDQTLVYSQRIINEKDLSINLNNDENRDNHFIEIYTDNQKYLYLIQVRKGLKEFISKLEPYCNFFVNTMANPIYIEKVLTLLNQKYNLNLNNDTRINNVFITYPKNKKTLPPEITTDGNFLILDDNVCAWDKTYLSHIIPIRKYYGFFDNNAYSEVSSYKINYQYYFFGNKIYYINEIKREFYDFKNKLPFCSEASWSEINQLKYISELIIKTYLLNNLLYIPIYYAFYNILNSILKDCKIFYDGEDKSFIQDLILLLGGKLVTNIDDASIVLINENKNNCEYKLIYDKYKLINIKWLFDCYFSFVRCDDEKYKIK